MYAPNNDLPVYYGIAAALHWLCTQSDIRSPQATHTQLTIHAFTFKLSGLFHNFNLQLKWVDSTPLVQFRRSPTLTE